jgi:hypothetical protein
LGNSPPDCWNVDLPRPMNGEQEWFNDWGLQPRAKRKRVRACRLSCVLSAPSPKIDTIQPSHRFCAYPEECLPSSPCVDDESGRVTDKTLFPQNSGTPLLLPYLHLSLAFTSSPVSFLFAKPIWLFSSSPFLSPRFSFSRR